MAEKHEIEIDIDPNGNVSFQVKGVKGKKCLELTKEFEELLGIVVKRDKTTEFYQTETQLSQQVEQKKE